MSASQMEPPVSGEDTEQPHLDASRVLHLSPKNTVVRNNGIQFHYDSEIPKWTELAVHLHDPADGAEIKGTGVVVACSGDCHKGYEVSMVLLNLSEAHQARLGVLAYSHLA